MQHGLRTVCVGMCVLALGALAVLSLDRHWAPASVVKLDVVQMGGAGASSAASGGKYGAAGEFTVGPGQKVARCSVMGEALPNILWVISLWLLCFAFVLRKRQETRRD
jgi:hypothetical protein